jgi:transcriptional regulator GlxA family with amidase domain
MPRTVPTRTVAIVVFDDVEVLDFAGPFEVFTVAGELIPHAPHAAFFACTVGLTGETVAARGGLRITPHYALSTCPTPDILIVPGGYGVRRLLAHDRFLDWLRSTAPRTELTCSVCTGALALASAGLLETAPATTHHTAFDALRAIEPTAQIAADQRFITARPATDGRGAIMTAGGISAGIDLSLHVVEQLCGRENAALVRTEMEWEWHRRG